MYYINVRFQQMDAWLIALYYFTSSTWRNIYIQFESADEVENFICKKYIF